MLGRNKKESAEGSLVLRALLVGFVAGYFTRKRGDASRIARANLAGTVQTDANEAVHDLTLPDENQA